MEKLYYASKSHYESVSGNAYLMSYIDDTDKKSFTGWLFFLKYNILLPDVIFEYKDEPIIQYAI